MTEETFLSPLQSPNSTDLCPRGLLALPGRAKLPLRTVRAPREEWCMGALDSGLISLGIMRVCCQCFGGEGDIDVQYQQIRRWGPPSTAERLMTPTRRLFRRSQHGQRSVGWRRGVYRLSFPLYLERVCPRMDQA